MHKRVSYQRNNAPDSDMSNAGLLRMTAMFALLLLLALSGGHHIGGPMGALVAALLVLLAGAGIYWWADTLILRMAGARRLKPGELPWLGQRVAELAHQASLPTPRIYLIESSTPNAFATGRAPTRSSVAVTTAITNLLTHDELAGVLAHELSHIRQSHTTITTMTALLAGSLAIIFCPRCWPALPTSAQQRDTVERTGWLYTLLVGMMTPFAALFVQLGSTRGREYQADAQGAALLGDPLLLASALEKIEWAAREVPMHANPGLASLYFVSPLPQHAGMLRFFNTHPSTASRVALLRTLARQGWPDKPALPTVPGSARHDAL